MAEHKDNVIKLYKNEGETPLKALDRLRQENPAFRQSSLTYVGRLDPMAEGLLLVLVDGAQSEREQYLGLDKTYRVEVLFGVQTDTGDILGVVQGGVGSAEVNIDKLQRVFKDQVGTFTKSYPAYSSKPVDGKPLFLWAREGKLGQIEIPTHEIVINSIELIGIKNVTGSVLLQEIQKRIDTVVGDFRQEEIKKQWISSLSEHESGTFVLADIMVLCGSGAYMRQMAQEVGSKLGVPALAYRIKREAVGGFKLD